MKSFKTMYSEVAQPKSPEEKAFKDQHEIEVAAHPVAPESQFKGTIEKKKRIADNDETTSKTSYDKAYGVAFESAELEEDANQEKDMMIRQLHFISYAAEEITGYLRNVQDPQEWYQNKLASVFDQIKSLYAYAAGDKHMNAGDAAPEERRFYEETDLSESTKFKAGTLSLDDGSKVKVAPKDAELLNQMFKDLNTANQKQFSKSLMADKDGFQSILDFAKEAL